MSRVLRDANELLICLDDEKRENSTPVNWLQTGAYWKALSKASKFHLCVTCKCLDSFISMYLLHKYTVYLVNNLILLQN